MSVEHRATTVHLMVLVHGIKGNHLELAYVKEALERELTALFSKDSKHTDKFLVHAATCNDYNTLDGIEAGGRRLANEINDLIQNLVLKQEEDVEKNRSDHEPMDISLSILGHSLGGLYARYALAFIDWDLSHSHHQGQLHEQETARVITVKIIPQLFVTTATPHLGIRDMTYWNVPPFMYPAGAWYMKQSGNDLLRYTNVIHRLCMDEEFLRPLACFSKRMAYANAFSTDAAVPTSTAAFLSDSSHVLHVMDDNTEDNLLDMNSMVPTVRFQTQCSVNDSSLIDTLEPCSSDNNDVKLFSQRLDSLGWTKVFIDVRSHIAALWKRGHRAQDWDRILQQSTYTSAELNNLISTFDWNTMPFGHSFLVASCKNSMYRWFYSGGRPLVDCIAKELSQEMFSGSAISAKK